MRSSLQGICDLFVENREVIRASFKMEYSAMYPVCANIFCEKGLWAHTEDLEASKRLLRANTGLFSSFRGNMRMPLSCMLAASDEPETKLKRALSAHDALRDSFWPSDYLALTAFLLADAAIEAGLPNEELTAYIRRGRGIYDRMKKEHPLLTSQEDCVFAVLMAFSEKTDDGLVSDMETAFQILKRRFHRDNGTQTASHVLAQAEGKPEKNAADMIDLYDEISRAGGKYGKYHHLATLSALSVLGVDHKRLASDIMEMDSFLAQQKGYGFLGLDKRTRLMHAAMLLASDYARHSYVETAALSSTLVMIAAQQAATYAAIASTTTSTAAASSR